MARKKRGSRVLDRAQRRFAGVQSIDPKLALTKKLTMQIYSTYIADLGNKLTAYNKVLSDADALRNDVSKAEDLLAEYSEQMLMGIGGEFGKDSNEYEKAGGVKTSDRKRPTRKVAVAAS